MMHRTRYSTRRGGWLTMLLRLHMLLSMAGLASAALLKGRQANDFSAEHPNDSDASDQLTSLAATAPSPTGAIEVNANATAASNGTIKATSVSSAAAVATTASSHLNNTNDPHMCHKEYTTDPEGVTNIPNPFCKPVDGQEVYPDIQYEVTWDPSLFDDSANNTVQVYHADNTGLNSPATADILTSLNATDFPGAVFLNISAAWLNGQSTTNLTLSLIVNESGEKPKSFTGPTFTLLSTSSSADSSHSTPSSAPSSSKKLGEKVGLPVGLVFFIVVVIAAALFICFRRRKGKGYGAGKSLRQRVGGAAGSGSTRGHRRGASFHDEPTTGGVELRDRNRGETPEDSWDWGSPVSSPRTAGTGGAGNAFRDEIQRQRSGR